MWAMINAAAPPPMNFVVASASPGCKPQFPRIGHRLLHLFESEFQSAIWDPHAVRFPALSQTNPHAYLANLELRTESPVEPVTIFLRDTVTNRTFRSFWCHPDRAEFKGLKLLMRPRPALHA
jgi:hypothetical protein